MLLASPFQGRLLDLFSPSFHLLSSTEVDISRRHVVQRLMIPFVVVTGNKILNGLFQLPGEVEGLKLDHIFHQAVVAFNLALRHGMTWVAAYMG